MNTKTTDEEIAILKRNTKGLLVLILITAVALLATVITYNKILDKEFSLPSSHQGTK